jgi:parallel beta-helix repeat protein
LKITAHLLLSLFILLQSAAAWAAGSQPHVNCGDILTEDTVLDADLTCPQDTIAIHFGASNITLDLGGHTLSGYDPGTGILAQGYEGITIRNGTIEGFHDGVFLIDARNVIIEDLTIRKMDDDNPDHLVMGVHIGSSQGVVVRDVLFEFPPVAHKEAIDVFNSEVMVSNIEVNGGGAGVNFSFAGECDLENFPNYGVVRDSKFSDIYIAAVAVACCSDVLIEGNDISTHPGVGVGIQGDALYHGEVNGITIRDNLIHDTAIGIELRGTLTSTITENTILDNFIWGVAIRQSLGCISPEMGWECFYSSGNEVTYNTVLGNGTDLYHYQEAIGNTWANNICETTEGVEIPACLAAFTYQRFVPLVNK